MEKKQSKAGLIFLIIIVVIVIIAFVSDKKDEVETNAKISELPNRYYYNQLNEGYKKYGQKIYKELYENKESLKNGTYDITLDEIFSDELEKNKDEGEKYVVTSIWMAKRAFKRENPEIFYVDFNKLSYKIIESDKYRVVLGTNDENYYIDGVSSKEDVKKMEQELKNSTSKLMNELNGLSNDYEKIKKVHDYLIETIEYTDTPNAYNIYGALVEKKCVCEGYALAFQYFMNELGIDSMIISGTVKHDGGTIWVIGDTHAWNYVKLNGNWYAVDTTWDDVENKEYTYFLKGKNTMEINHTEAKTIGDMYNHRVLGAGQTYEKLAMDETLTYPDLSLQDY